MNDHLKQDSGKAPWHLLAWDAAGDTVRVLDFGQTKYRPRGWEAGMAWSRCYAAAIRHLTAWWRGQDRDPETGLPHLAHAACCVMFLQAYGIRGVGEDDRPESEDRVVARIRLPEDSAEPVDPGPFRAAALHADRPASVLDEPNAERQEEKPPRRNLLDLEDEQARAVHKAVVEHRPAIVELTAGQMRRIAAAWGPGPVLPTFVPPEGFYHDRQGALTAADARQDPPLVPRQPHEDRGWTPD